MSDFKVLLVYPNLQMINLLPSNISILSACLREKGFKVDLFDTTFYQVEEKSIDERRTEYLQVRPFDLASVGIHYKPGNVYDDFDRKIEEYKPDLIAVSVVEDTWPLTLDLLQYAIAGERLEIPVLAGGVHPTLNPMLVLSRPEIDMICVGEGEAAVPELCNSMAAGEDIRVENIWTKEGRKIKTSPVRPPIDINQIPYNDFTLFEKRRFYRPMQGKIFRMIPIEIDRGCPYGCTFCAAPSLRSMYRRGCGKEYYRLKSNDRIIEELKHQVDKYNAEYIYFNSETMLAMNDERFEELATLYRNEVRLPFWCQTRIETVSEKKIALLENMGCDRISVGIEQGNETFRRNMLKKRFTNTQVHSAFDILGNHHIPVTVNNMMGFPGETRALAFDTIRLNRSLNADSTNVFAFKPYHGTYLHDVAVQMGYLKDDDIITSMIDSTLDMPQFSRKEINGLIRTFPLYMSLPEDRFDEIRQAETDDEEYDRLAKEYRKVKWGIE